MDMLGPYFAKTECLAFLQPTGYESEVVRMDKSEQARSSQAEMRASWSNRIREGKWGKIHVIYRAPLLFLQCYMGYLI